MAKRMLPVVGTVLMLFCSFAYGQAGGGGASTYEVGIPDQGASAAGAGARAQDPSTAYTNPAGMTRLEGNGFLLGINMIYPDQSLQLSGDTISVPPGSTNGGGSIGQLVPGLGSYFVTGITDDLKFGFSVNAPWAGAVGYDDDWVGNSFVAEALFLAMNFEPALAYRVCDWLSVGAGLNVVLAVLNQEFRLGPGSTLQGKIDGARDWSLGYSLGVMVEPRDGTRIGVTYRSPVELNLEGDFQSPVPAVTADLEASFELPQGINVAVYHDLTDTLALLFDAGWTDWSEFGRMEATVGPFSATADRQMRDTWRVGAGFQWDVAESWLLRGGYSFDSSPILDSLRLPDMPLGEWHRFSLGMQHDLNEHTTVSVSYTYACLGDGDVDHVALPPTGAVVLDGEYDPNSIHFLGVTLELKL